MPARRVSVIFATFNQPAALRFVLIGYRRQTFLDFELIIADDGSGPETRAMVEEMRPEMTVPIEHVRQENKGFRKARILNEAVLHSRGELLVFSDGDCIPHRDFVRLHVEHRPPQGYSVGGWVNLTREQTLALKGETVALGEYEALATPALRLSDRVRHVKNLVYREFGKLTAPRVRGRNFAVSRRRLLELNGYDENYEGFSKEDSDLRNRLNMAGAKSASLYGRSWVYHVHSVIDEQYRHRLVPRAKNWEYYRRPDVTPRCPNGIFKDGEASNPSVCPRCGRALEVDQG